MTRRGEQHPHQGDWLRDFVFGLNDGLVTTLVFVIAVSAVARAQIVLIAFGELFAGGISMALGGFLSARTSRELLAHRIATERLEIETEPDEERAELRAIYREKGIRGALLNRVVAELTADEERWLRVLVRDELGVVDDAPVPPWRQGAVVGVAFMVGAFVPIVPFLTPVPQPQWGAYGLTALVAFGLGAVKARFIGARWWRSGVEFLVIVTLGTLAGVAIGTALHAITGGYG